MEATFDSTKLTREREVHVVCSVRKVIIDMSSRRATLKKKLNKKNKKTDNEQLFYEGALDMK